MDYMMIQIGKRKAAFARLEKLRKKGTVVDDTAELASYSGRKVW